MPWKLPSPWLRDPACGAMGPGIGVAVADTRGIKVQALIAAYNNKSSGPDGRGAVGSLPRAGVTTDNDRMGSQHTEPAKRRISWS